MINKDLVLREHLAIERTKLANETTLLAYIRTGLYFLVAGSTLGHIVQSAFWQIVEFPLMIIGVGLMIIGLIRFSLVKRLIKRTRKEIGEATDEFVGLVRGSNELD
jgi:putative membrane protein